MPLIRETLRQQGISRPAATIILASCRTSTRKSYKSALGKWIHFCSRRETHPTRTDVTTILGFLAKEFLSGSQYSNLNIARSAVSAVLPPIDGIPVGSHPLVKRLMKGAFNMRPPKPRYTHTWDVTVVFNYWRTLGPNKDLSLKSMTMKLVTLTALISGQRCQTLSLINTDGAQVRTNGVEFIIDSPTKTSKVGKPHVTVELTAYPNDPLLCAMSLLKIYLEKTKPFRGTERRLFLSYVPPYKAVGAETISRWIKSTLQLAGVDTNRFTAHSTRSAACSAASRYGVPLDVS